MGCARVAERGCNVDPHCNRKVRGNRLVRSPEM